HDVYVFDKDEAAAPLYTTEWQKDGIKTVVSSNVAKFPEATVKSADDGRQVAVKEITYVVQGSNVALVARAFDEDATKRNFVIDLRGADSASFVRHTLEGIATVTESSQMTSSGWPGQPLPFQATTTRALLKSVAVDFDGNSELQRTLTYKDITSGHVATYAV